MTINTLDSLLLSPWVNTKKSPQAYDNEIMGSRETYEEKKSIMSFAKFLI